MINTSIISGENYVFNINDGGVWKPYYCARSGNINIVTETIETSTSGSGIWRTFEPTANNFSAQIDGVISVDDTHSLQLSELRALQFSQTKILCRFTATSFDGDVYIEEAYFIITNSVSTGSFDGVATFSLSLQGTGAITQIFTPPTPNLTGKVYRYPSAGSTAPVAPGLTTVTIAGLGNKTILSVFKDGIGNNDIILSGTPVDKEVLYQTSGSDGVFTWAIPFDGESFFILYQNV